VLVVVKSTVSTRINGTQAELVTSDRARGGPFQIGRTKVKLPDMKNEDSEKGGPPVNRQLRMRVHVQDSMRRSDGQASRVTYWAVEKNVLRGALRNLRSIHKRRA